MAPVQKPGRSKQDYGTPPEFLDAVRRRLGIRVFTWDLAASPENAVAARYYTEADNSLAQVWGDKDGWCWLNPPFADIAPWAEKAFTSGTHVAMLVPASVGANWWATWVHGRACVRFLQGRLTFVGCEDPYPKDCALVLYGPSVYADYTVWNWRL